MIRDNKVVVVVIDALGVDTLKNYMGWTGRYFPRGLLSRMGISKILYGYSLDSTSGMAEDSFHSLLTQRSKTPSSVMGHREMVGINNQTPYKLFPDGFPQDYLDTVAKKLMENGLRNPLRTDGKIDFIFNQICGGTKAIEMNYNEHERTGFPIVYASMCDPLIQIAVNRKIWNKDESDMMAEVAFELAEEHNLLMERAISRPYENTGDKRIRRNDERHDRVIPITQRTLIDLLVDREFYTSGIGKIPDLVPGRWTSEIGASQVKIKDEIFVKHLEDVEETGIKGSNAACLQALYNELNNNQGGFYFVNLVDTDSNYGHTCKERVNGKLVCNGAIDELIRIDKSLEYIFNSSAMQRGDILIVTADHGMQWNDKEQYGYHSIEPLPLMVNMKGRNTGGVSLMSKSTLASVGYIVAEEAGGFHCGQEFEDMCKARKLINWYDDFLR